MRPVFKQSDGITLLELSIVILLLSIMLGFTMPRFTTMFESDLYQETKKLAKLIRDLRFDAILKNENYRLEFDTKKSEYSVLVQNSEDPEKYEPHQRFSKPISLKAPVELVNVSRITQPERETRFGGRRLEFDKIFGQKFTYSIDSSGFVDMFKIRLKDKNNQISLSVENIMGKLKIGEEIPL